MKGNGIARISYRNGGLFLPAKTPYEVEVLVEHVGALARQHGEVRLSLHRCEWLVARYAGAASLACSTCREALANLVFTGPARQRLCGRCARSEVLRGAVRRPRFLEVLRARPLRGRPVPPAAERKAGWWPWKQDAPHAGR